MVFLPDAVVCYESRFAVTVKLFPETLRKYPTECTTAYTVSHTC